MLNSIRETHRHRYFIILFVTKKTNPELLQILIMKTQFSLCQENFILMSCLNVRQLSDIYEDCVTCLKCIEIEIIIYVTTRFSVLYECLKFIYINENIITLAALLNYAKPSLQLSVFFNICISYNYRQPYFHKIVLIKGYLYTGEI